MVLINIEREDGKREWIGPDSTQPYSVTLPHGGKVIDAIVILDTPTYGTQDVALHFSSPMNSEELEEMTDQPKETLQMNPEDLNDLFEYYRDFVDEMSEKYPSKIETYLGLADEAGEVLGVLKKIERDGETTPMRLDQLYDEMGDVLHYFVRLMNEFDIELVDLIEGNIDKLVERHD